MAMALESIKLTYPKKGNAKGKAKSRSDQVSPAARATAKSGACVVLNVRRRL